MDKEYIFTRSEFAKMLDIKPNTLRMRMRRGQYKDVSKFLKNKWMFKRVRLNLVKCASSLSPVSRHRKHVITKHGTTNYDNIRNSGTAIRFKDRNDTLRLDKKWGHLSEKQLDALLLLADKEQQKDFAEKQRKADETIKKTFKAPLSGYVIVDGKKRDPFELAEEDRLKRHHDEWLMEQDRIESGYYNRQEVKSEYY